MCHRMSLEWNPRGYNYQATNHHKELQVFTLQQRPPCRKWTQVDSTLAYLVVFSFRRRNQSEQSVSGFTGSCGVQCSVAWQNFSGTRESLIKSLEQQVDIWSSLLTLTATAWHNQWGRVSFGFRVTARLLLPKWIQNLQTSSFYERACLLCDSVWSGRRYVLAVE